MLWIFLAALVAASSAVDEISDLPGVDFDIDFNHYSGFLQVSDNHLLHYWFVESQNDPSSDPLLFWFNGGPGCSSLDGLLNEMGPYTVDPDGTHMNKNEYAWNKVCLTLLLDFQTISYSWPVLSTSNLLLVSDSLMPLMVTSLPTMI